MSNSVIAMYNDSSVSTTSVTWTVYEDSYGGNIISQQTSTSQNILFTQSLNSTTMNKTLFGVMNITYGGYNYAYGGLIQQGNYTNVEINDLTTEVGRDYLNWIITLLISVIALSFTIRTANIGTIVVCGIAAIFIFFKLFSVTWVLLSIAVAISLVMLLKEKSNVAG